MRILDKDDNELQLEDLDLDKGQLLLEQKIIKEHPAQERVEAIQHYKVKTFYFSDGTSLDIEDEHDPHVIVEDLDAGCFSYQNLPGEEEKTVHGIELEYVTDKEGQEPREAWTEYEDIQRWIPYTEEELQARKEEEERQAKQQQLLNTGLDSIEALNLRADAAENHIHETQVTLDDVVLMMADIVNA